MEVLITFGKTIWNKCFATVLNIGYIFQIIELYTLFMESIDRFLNVPITKIFYIKNTLVGIENFYVESPSLISCISVAKEIKITIYLNIKNIYSK